MKKRSQARHQGSWISTRRPLGIFSRAKRKRKKFSFETLESRYAFSAAPLEGVQFFSYSNDTLEGAFLTWQRELEWYARQYATAANLPDPQYITQALPSDPMFPYQWHILNVGQEVGQPHLQPLYGVAGEDLNVVPVWGMGYTGNGVVVAVVDDGVQLFHPDLVANISPTLRYNAINGTTNVIPSLVNNDYHGTAVAGIIGATANNGIGGTGVAPGSTLVPIRLLGQGFTQQTIVNMLQWSMQNGVDITNNSWGLLGENGLAGREIIQLTPEVQQALRNTVVFGRDGLGMIHVFASGNNAGPFFTTGFGGIGNYDSASYDPLVNSRYTIGVTGVDHDGLYINADGTFFTYPMAGPSVLVAAPTGSLNTGRFSSIGSDDGYGSGIWTTDLMGDFGANAAPLPNGFDPDFDFWPDADYSSRFNGTSASAPMVAGVIALMLEANPNLTYRDVQEILVRSARQNAQFESPASGGLTGPLASQNTWQVNQIQPFRNPDPFDPSDPRWQGVFTALFFPIADPNIEGFQFGGTFYAPDSNDGNRQGGSNYEPLAALFTNGAGYTVSQGYGVYGEQIGYGHGVVDAELAVLMARDWHNLGQNLAPNTERTYTTGIINQGPNTGWNIPAAEKGTPPPDGPAFVVPGGIGGLSGFIPYWNEYFTDDPFADYTGPSPTRRGNSYIDFAVPPSQSVDVEWVEVRMELVGPAADLDFMRIFLVSPDGTHSELNHFYGDPALAAAPSSFQPSSRPPAFIDPVGNINNTGDSFIWSFTTNRHWGESTNSLPLIHPVTGEPVLDLFGQPIFRNWELHIENWSNSTYIMPIVEVIFHGKPINGGSYDPNYAAEGVQKAQRVQGFVGIDTNNDEQFNYNRYVQFLFGNHTDVDTIRDGDVVRRLDFNDNNFNGIFDEGDTINQEPFAANILVEAYRVVNGVVETTPTARFITGHDGNYYFDLDPTFEYEIRITDPLGRVALNDVPGPNDPAPPPGFEYLARFQQSWRITPDWFYAPDRDNGLLLTDEPGRILYDPNTGAPVPFTNNGFLAPVPMAVKNINFLLKQDAPVDQFIVTGTVYADINGNGKFDGDDAPHPNVFVYWDIDRNGVWSAGEPRVMTDDSGNYTLLIDLTTLPTVPTGNATYQIGVIKPDVDWTFTDPLGDGVEMVFAGPGSTPQIVNFFLKPPAGSTGGNNQLGSILGVVFNDLNKNGARDVGEGGLPGIRVYIDANENGVWDANEVSVITASNGSYFLADVPEGLWRIDVHIPNEGTANAAWAMTFPSIGYRQVNLAAGATVINQHFGLENRADHDWGDLPDSYRTSAAANGPRHKVIPGFRLGSSIDGEINGVPSPLANSDDLVGDVDDGVRVISNGGILKEGVNLFEVTVWGFGGVLTGWIDWNNDGQFTPDEKILWHNESGGVLGLEADLVQGTYVLQVMGPPGLADGGLAARFRWGEPGLDYFGPALIGEVEDYILTAIKAPLTGLPGDYNNDGQVDNADFVVWRRLNNTNLYLPNDTTPGTVSQEDYAVWLTNVGTSMNGSGSGSVSEPLVDDTQGGAASAVEEETLESLPASQSALVVDVVNVTGVAEEVAPVASAAPALASVVNNFFGLESVSIFSTGSALESNVVSVDNDSDATLLLLDEVLADFDAEEEDEPVVDRFGHEGDSYGELELAAVFEDESSWWGA